MSRAVGRAGRRSSRAANVFRFQIPPISTSLFVTVLEPCNTSRVQHPHHSADVLAACICCYAFSACEQLLLLQLAHNSPCPGAVDLPCSTVGVHGGETDMPYLIVTLCAREFAGERPGGPGLIPRRRAGAVDVATVPPRTDVYLVIARLEGSASKSAKWPPCNPRSIPQLAQRDT